MSKNQAGIVAIVGRANVGKSTLFNALIGHREAVTAREPGTTRDSLTAKAHWADSDFWLVDTAGLKTASDEFETTIQNQISQSASAADVIMVVAEATAPVTEEDRRVAKLALKTGKPVVLVVNKVDANKKVDLSTWQSLGIKPILAASAIHKLGLEDILSHLSDQLPKGRIRRSDDRIKLAILGRPNVGKSSLFNALGKKQQALVADRAGTTRDVNRLALSYHSREIEVMDTAGIRRSGKVEVGIEKFSVLRSLAAIEEADICLLLIEVDEPSVHLDQKIAGLIKEAGKGLILIISKWDKIGPDSLDKSELSRVVAADYAFAPWAPLVFTSAETGENVVKIFELTLDIANARKEKMKTSELNRWLQTATSHHPPAGFRNRQPKLNYIVQEDDQPLPSFKIFGGNVKFLHWSYRRYLERSFRETWPLPGTPIKFWFIDKNETVK